VLRERSARRLNEALRAGSLPLRQKIRMRRTMIRMMASTVPTPIYIEPSF
jgi:hypothetical protein